MNIKQTFIALLIINSAINIALAQTSSPNDFSKKLLENKADTLEINKMLDLAKENQKSDINIALAYSKKALQMSREIELVEKTAQSQLLLGILLNEKGEFNNAMKYLDSCLVYYELLNDIDQIGEATLHIANSFLKLGVYDKSMLFVTKSQQYFEQSGNLKGKANCLNIIGGINMYQRNFDAALKCFEQKLFIVNELKDDADISKTYNNMGIIFKNQHKYDLALMSYNKALVILEETEQIYRAAEIYNNIGIVYRNLKKYDEALEYYNKALMIKEEHGSPKLIASTLNNMAVAYNEKGMHKTAIEIASKSLSLVDSLQIKVEKFYALENLAYAYDKLGEYSYAYEYQSKYYEVKDKLFDEKKHKQIKALEIKYETEKKEREIVSLTKEKELQKAESKNKTYLITVLGLIILMATIITYFYIKNQKNKLRRKIIEERANEAEKQKKRFAKELHDGTGSNLTGIRLQLLAIKEATGSNGEMSELIKEVERTHQGVRLLAYQTSPPEFDNSTLDELLNDLVRRLTKTGSIKINYLSTVDLDWSKTNENYQLEIYRITQEALSNVIKHSKAENVDIQLIQHDNSFNLMIEDNGKGFVPKSENEGLGMKTIRERTKNLYGALQIDSTPGKGTSLIIDFPIPEIMKNAIP